MKVLIIHFRVGRTDGVSLEIAAWKEILAKNGWEVELAGGKYSVGANYVVPHLENQLDPLVYELDNEAFGGFKKLTEEDFEQKFSAHQKSLEREFEKLLSTAKPDRLIVSNLFSVGENLAAAGALSKVLERSRVPTVMVNHDFYWENTRYDQPSCPLVAEQLAKYFPYAGENIKHCCINSLAKEQLLKRKGIRAEIIYDTLDFKHPVPIKRSACWGVMTRHGIKGSDLVVLQATRVIRRKNIELAMDVVAAMGRRISRMTLYDGRVFDPAENRLVLVMAGYAEKRDEWYLDRLKEYALELGIWVVHLDGVAAGNNQENEDEVCTLLNVYPYADLITYPSAYEGFGNQFLEAVFARKPVCVFEYPVFVSDIAPLGFETISLGREVTSDPGGLVKLPPMVVEKAAEEILELLGDQKKHEQMIEKNFA